MTVKANLQKIISDTLKKYVAGDGASAVCISGGDKKEEWSISCGDNSVQWTISKNSKGKCRVSKSAEKLSCDDEDTGDESENTCECDFSDESAKYYNNLDLTCSKKTDTKEVWAYTCKNGEGSGKMAHKKCKKLAKKLNKVKCE